MSYTYYENWRRESLRRLDEARSLKKTVETLIHKSGSDEKEILARLEEVSHTLSDAEGLHKRYKYPDSIKRSAKAVEALKELQYLVLASRD